jgi:hypothetical protein
LEFIYFSIEEEAEIGLFWKPAGKEGHSHIKGRSHSTLNRAVLKTTFGLLRLLNSKTAIVSRFGCPLKRLTPLLPMGGRPGQAEEPYFVDEKLNRSDMRSNPADNLVKLGVSLRLVSQVSQVGDCVCTPLSNAVIDVWHCDAEGVYSDVNDRDLRSPLQEAGMLDEISSC